jgi:hypothetical protein
MKATTEQFMVSVCLNIPTDITNDSSSRQKGVDARVKLAQWIKTELNIPAFKNAPAPSKLDISNGYGEVEIYDCELIHTELL